MSDTKPTPTAEKTPRYAGYDQTMLRFVGGVHDTRAAAAEAAKAAGARRVTVREV